jgi:hypothetical protein
MRELCPQKGHRANFDYCNFVTVAMMLLLASASRYLAARHSRMKRRRFRNLNPCCLACRRQLSFFSARSLLAAAIAPGVLGFEGADWPRAANVPIETNAATAAELMRMRNIISSSPKRKIGLPMKISWFS